MNITKDIRYIGVNDHEIDLFEGQYIVPNGMAYNSYAIIDDKTAVIDTVDVRFRDEWFGNIKAVLGGKVVLSGGGRRKYPEGEVGGAVQSAAEECRHKVDAPCLRRFVEPAPVYLEPEVGIVAEYGFKEYGISFKMHRYLNALCVLGASPSQRYGERDLSGACHGGHEAFASYDLTEGLHDRLLRPDGRIIGILYLETESSSVTELIESKSG